MKAKVLDNLCIGCGACAALVPDEFEINGDGVAEAINDKVVKEDEELVVDAKENCPTSAIQVENE